jgi:transcriptional regulator with XRE-family HTH domain
MDTLGGRLRQLRQQAGLSQEALGRELGLAQQTIGHYEIGLREPPLDVINHLAQRFKVSVDYLLGRTDDPTPPSADLSEVLSTDEAITLAFSKVGGPLARLSPEAIRSVKDYIQFVYERERKEATERGGVKDT